MAIDGLLFLAHFPHIEKMVFTMHFISMIAHRIFHIPTYATNSIFASLHNAPHIHYKRVFSVFSCSVNDFFYVVVSISSDCMQKTESQMCAQYRLLEFS